MVYGSTGSGSGSGMNPSKNKVNKNMEWILKMEETLAKDSVDLLDIKRMYRFLDKNVKKEDERIEEMEEDSYTESEEENEEDMG
jgi:hypothetical protein